MFMYWNRHIFDKKYKIKTLIHLKLMNLVFYMVLKTGLFSNQNINLFKELNKIITNWIKNLKSFVLKKKMPLIWAAFLFLYINYCLITIRLLTRIFPWSSLTIKRYNPSDKLPKLTLFVLFALVFIFETNCPLKL